VGGGAGTAPLLLQLLLLLHGDGGMLRLLRLP